MGKFSGAAIGKDNEDNTIQIIKILKTKHMWQGISNTSSKVVKWKWYRV